MNVLQASKQQLEEYAGLQHSHEPSEASAMVCDRCLQAIDSAIFQKNKSRLEEAFRQASGASRQEQQMLDSKKVQSHDFVPSLLSAILALNPAYPASASLVSFGINLPQHSKNRLPRHAICVLCTFL